jgi:hypothetical protein
MALITGYSRGTWNSGSWNSPSPVLITGENISSAVGNVTVTGNSLFSAIGEDATLSVNNVTISGAALFDITGEELNISQGEEVVSGTALFDITGEDLISTTVDSFAVLADGSITINTPTFEANVELNNDGIQLGLATFFDVTGISISANLGTVITSTENIIDITGEELTTTVNTITLSTQQILSMTGNGVTITSANIVPNSENFISIDGNQANTNVTSLKFWDPITGNITETWTNIH